MIPSASAAIVSGLAAIAMTAGPAQAFAPAATAAVHPGVQTVTDGGQCTSNFVFKGADGTYLGQAAHCASTGAQTDTNGCTSPSLPLGTEVDVEGATKPGTLVYSSWLKMQADNESDPNACAFNDLALVKLDPADAAQTNPSIPFFGGPTGLNTEGTKPLEGVSSYGNSSLRQGIDLLKPKLGTTLQTDSGGWNHSVLTVTPGIPGDSGSAFLDAQGRALGVLSTLALLPLPLSNGVGDISRELDYANAHTELDVSLAPGDRPFRPLGG